MESNIVEEKKIKSLTLNGLDIPNAINIICSIAIIGVSIYLTNHYFEALFPTGLQTSTLCNISSFWSCDSAVFSPVSNIYSIPISFFGILFGSFLLIGTIFPSKTIEQTNKLMVYVNACMCVLLLIYSLVVLQTLCPFCTIFYILSFIVCYLFYKYAVEDLSPSPKVMSFYLIPAFIGAALLFNNFKKKEEKQLKLGKSLIDQFYGLAQVGDPGIDSKFIINAGKQKFNEAPIRMSIFSDFECPACRSFSKVLPKLIQKYKKDLNIQYFFYPLDDNCNPNMTNPMHPLACEVSYLSVCLSKEFSHLHDEIFEQEPLTQKWINSVAKDKGVFECLKFPETKKQVVGHIEFADTYNINSTPTIILNGVKIEGGLPEGHFRILFDEILKRAKNK